MSNRIGSKLHGTEDLVDFSTATTPLDVKVKQALRGARETLHPAEECLIAVCDHSDFKMDVLLAHFSDDL